MPVPKDALGIFELANPEYVFAPSMYPSVVVSKSRNKDRQDNLCDGETITDTGSKNREILITGKVYRSELAAFDGLLDLGDPLDLLSDEWVGEIEIIDGEYRQYAKDMYSYQLNIVSTGKDEGTYVGDGVISSGQNLIASGTTEGFAQGDGI
jgi:hypothetical protein